jgi:DNA-binding response OmpR family regulator
MSAKPRVAVVEDDASIGVMITQSLALEGFDVTVFTDGTSASARVRTAAPDAVVLDIMLPGKDGLTILRELRQSPATAELPIVMLSAKTDSSTAWQGWTGGANYVMPKPFAPDELARVLHSLIGQQEPSRIALL